MSQSVDVSAGLIDGRGPDERGPGGPGGRVADLRAADRAERAQGLAPHPVLGRFYRSAGERRAFVQGLFERSARRYDRIDAVASLGTGSRYRRRVLRASGLRAGMSVLDVGCGTGLVAAPAAEIVGPAGWVVGVDPCGEMRRVAASRGGFEVVDGVAEALPVDDASFDMVTMGYALRHVEDLGAAFAEFARVLRPGGRVVILEITPPRSRVGRSATSVVMRGVVPVVAGVVSLSLDGWRLMRYFWETIDRCIPPERVLGALTDAGFEGAERSVELGVFSVYTGQKPPEEGPARERTGS